MRLARATAGHVPAHARPARHAVVAPRRGRRSIRFGRWLPIMIIATLYLVAIAVNEWRLQRHVEELRERPSAEIVELPGVQPAALADVG